MKFTIPREQFLAGLQAVQSVVGNRNTLPILSHVLLRAADGRVELTATDLDVTVARAVPAAVETPGILTQPAKRLWSIVREMAPGDIEVEANLGGIERACSLRSGDSYYKIQGLDAEEFPATPEIRTRAGLTLSWEALAAMLRQVAPAMATDDSRPMMNSVLLRLEADRRVMVATDGRRLALVERASQESGVRSQETGDFILPAKLVQELGRLCAGAGEVEAGFSENQASFTLTEKSSSSSPESGGGTRIIARLLEGVYPNFRQVLPSEARVRIRLNREELRQAVRRAGMMTSEKTLAVRMTFTAGQLAITSNAPEVGEAVERMSAPYEGPELAIAFNPDYFMDALKGVDEEEVQLDLMDSLSPGVIRSGSGYLHVIMPMRIST